MGGLTKPIPISVFLKEHLIKKIAKERGLSEKVVAQIIGHQFKSMKAGIKEEHRSVELVGFGKFCFYEKKSSKRCDKYVEVMGFLKQRIENPKSTKEEIRITKAKFNTVLGKLKDLSVKFKGEEYDKIIENIRRMEEQFAAF